jgi:hypothetical protein
MKNIIKITLISLIVSATLAGVLTYYSVSEINSQQMQGANSDVVAISVEGGIINDPIYQGVFVSHLLWLFVASLISSMVAVRYAKTSNQ